MVSVFESWKRIKTSLSPLCFRISELVQNVFGSFWKNNHFLFIILWLDVEYMFSNIILKWVFLCPTFINDALNYSEWLFINRLWLPENFDSSKSVESNHLTSHSSVHWFVRKANDSLWWSKRVARPIRNVLNLNSCFCALSMKSDMIVSLYLRVSW